MTCKYCGRKIKPEITEKLEVWGVIQEARCPKCNMIISTKLKGFNETRRGRIPGLISLKELLKDITWK